LPTDRSFAILAEVMTISISKPSPTHPFAEEAADPDCIDPAVAAALLHDAPWERMVVLGDSVALGVREPLPGYRDASFADRVADALRARPRAFAYQNFGVRYLRLAEVRDTQLDLALALEPDLAIIAGGGNDALRRSFDPDRTRRELDEIVGALARRGATVVTTGLFDLARSGILPAEIADPMRERFDLLDDVTAVVAADHGAIHVDTHHHPRASDPGIFASDLMHANARGHAIAAAADVEALAAALR
jgi:lysophospholipase L1-like esterase